MVQSAGILVYKKASEGYKYLIAHPGGPYFSERNLGVWTLPKGEIDEGETDLVGVAIREFSEETGVDVWKHVMEKRLALKDIGSVTLKSGKIVHAWAVELDLDTTTMHSNNFNMEWPKDSGIVQSFPEIDKWEYCTLLEAKEMMNPAQYMFLFRI